MNNEAEKQLFAILKVMEELLLSLERKEMAAERFLQVSHPDTYREYRKALLDAESEHPSVAAQSLEELRKKLFPGAV